MLSVERRTLPGETPEKVEAEMSGDRYRDPALRSSLPGCRAARHRPVSVGNPRRCRNCQGSPGCGWKVLEALRFQLPGYRSGRMLLLLSSAGIPSVLLGPSGSGAHADEEWVDLSSVKTCADLYLATAVEFCS